MKRSKNIIIILSTALIVIGVIVGSICTQFSSEISTVVTTITAVIGAVALWIQFKKDRELNQSTFIVEFHKVFFEGIDNNKVMSSINNKFEGKPYIPFKDLHDDVLSYFYWIRTLCNLIERNVLTFSNIDELFAYRFFSITDNKEIQEMELIPYSHLYKSVYRVHRKWTEYRKKHNLINGTYADESLALVPDYDTLSK